MTELEDREMAIDLHDQDHDEFGQLLLELTAQNLNSEWLHITIYYAV